MEVQIKHLSGAKFEAEARGHKITCDQPVSNGGRDEGMTPPELLLAALGTCAAFYGVQYLKTRSLSTEGIEVSVSAEKALQPARLASFRVEVTAPDLDAAHIAGLERAVKTCLIHNTLLHPPTIDLAIRSVSPATLKA
ncbi:MAG TPA: OsmC family protein [Bryobacteraceae bacterium]|nr:OsmC family protein [Bryobacteraceae bacterium]